MSNFRKFFYFLFFEFRPELLDDLGWHAGRLLGLKLRDPLVKVVLAFVRIDDILLHLLLLLESNLLTLHVLDVPTLYARVLALSLVKSK